MCLPVVRSGSIPLGMTMTQAVYELRRARGRISQRALSEAAGLAPNYVSRAEAGRRSLEASAVGKLCAALREFGADPESFRVAYLKEVGLL